MVYFDLGGKAKIFRDRQVARAKLTGAVTTVVQVGAHNVRTQLSSGKSGSLGHLRLDTTGTASLFIKALSNAPMTEVIDLFKKKGETN